MLHITPSPARPFELLPEERLRIIIKYFIILSRACVNARNSKALDPIIFGLCIKYESSLYASSLTRKEYFEKIATRLDDIKHKTFKKLKDAGQELIVPILEQRLQILNIVLTRLNSYSEELVRALFNEINNIEITSNHITSHDACHSEIEKIVKKIKANSKFSNCCLNKDPHYAFRWEASPTLESSNNSSSSSNSSSSNSSNSSSISSSNSVSSVVPPVSASTSTAITPANPSVASPVQVQQNIPISPSIPRTTAKRPSAKSSARQSPASNTQRVTGTTLDSISAPTPIQSLGANSMFASPIPNISAGASLMPFPLPPSMASSTTSSANLGTSLLLREQNRYCIANVFKTTFTDPHLAPYLDLMAQDMELRIHASSRTLEEYLQNGLVA